MWQLLNGQSKSLNWSTSQLWARTGQSWSNWLFYTIFGRQFLYRNPEWPRKGTSRLAEVHRQPDNFWKFPETL